MSPHQVAGALTHEQRRVLRKLRGQRGTIAAARAFELRITRAVVAELVTIEAVQVDGVTGDLELTPAGHDLLETLDQERAR